MKKKLFTIAILAVSASLVIMSCSKTSNTTSGGAYAPLYNPNTSPQTTGGSTGGSTSGSLTFSSTGDPNGTFYGLLYSITAVLPGTPSYIGATADFYYTPMPFHLSLSNAPSSTNSVTAVYLNGTKFKYFPSQNYTDTTGILTFPPANWVVNGNSSIPSFTYNCTTPVPVYTGGTSLPTTIIRTQNLTIPTSGASGYDQIEIQVSDGTSARAVSLFSTAGSSSLVIPSDSLARLSATLVNGSISITLIKYNQQATGGKNFLFATVYNYMKNNIAIQ